MKKELTFFVAVLWIMFGGTTQLHAQATDLIISEYAEGSSNNKYVEIYNGTGATVNLANYQIWLVSNGGTWPETSHTLSGNLLNGEVLVIANASADASITGLSNATTAYNTATFFNGDDAVGLAKFNGTVFELIDAVGRDGADPGSGWDVGDTTLATSNHTLVRKPTVCSPDTNWTLSAGTNNANSQWIVYPIDTWTDAGVHTASCTSISGDTTKPEIITGRFHSTTSVTVVFSEPVTTASAQNTANYSITPSQSVTSAVLSASMDSVTLTVSPGFVNGQLYNVTIINVTDTSANANVMDPFNAMFYFNSYNGTDLKITEIMHSQATGSVGQIDYFEMHNTGTSSIALEGMEFTSGIQMNILTPLSIPAGGYLVFTQNIDSFNLAFPSVTNVIQWEGGSLSGGGETITMSNTLRDDVVSVSFMTSAPWPAYSNMEAIELCDVNTDYTNPSNWYYSANVSTTVGTTLYGTPGAASSCATPPFIPTYDIATVTSVDVDGVPDSLGVYCKVEGIVYGVDLDGNNGISFTLIDETGGINIFNFNDVDNYVVNQGDEIRAVGEIDFFNGLLELFPDSITVLSTGNCIPFPTVVSTLGEETESQYIELKNAKLANPSSWPSPGSNANLDVITANGDTVVMRIDRDTQIPDSLLAGPSGTFNLIGIGGQFDNSSPYLEGYQIFPMFVSDFDSTEYDAPAGLQMNEIAVVNSSTYADMDGDYSQWVEMFNNSGSTIDLTGYFLSTDSQNVFMERIERCFQNSPAQATIDAGEYGVGFTNSTKPGPQYFELEMTTANPFIGFYTPNGTLVDSYEFPTTVAVEGYTYGAKNDDHAQGDVIFEIGTPEATNAAGQILSVFSPSKINALVAYPNPVENGLVQFNKVVSVKVYSITGQILVVRENVKSLDVSTLNAGVYLLETEEGEVVRLLVK